MKKRVRLMMLLLLAGVVLLAFGCKPTTMPTFELISPTPGESAALTATATPTPGPTPWQPRPPVPLPTPSRTYPPELLILGAEDGIFSHPYETWDAFVEDAKDGTCDVTERAVPMLVWDPARMPCPSIDLGAHELFQGEHEALYILVAEGLHGDVYEGRIDIRYGPKAARTQYDPRVDGLYFSVSVTHVMTSNPDNSSYFNNIEDEELREYQMDRMQNSNGMRFIRKIGDIEYLMFKKLNESTYTLGYAGAGWCVDGRSFSLVINDFIVDGETRSFREADFLKLLQLVRWDWVDLTHDPPVTLGTMYEN